MTVVDGKLWVLSAPGRVVRIDPATNAVVGKPLPVPADAEAIAVAEGALWVARVAPGDLGTSGKDAVTRIDLASGRMVMRQRDAAAPAEPEPIRILLATRAAGRHLRSLLGLGLALEQLLEGGKVGPQRPLGGVQQ